MSQFSHYLAASLVTTAATAGGLMLADRSQLPSPGSATASTVVTTTAADRTTAVPYRYPDRTAVLNDQKTPAPAYPHRPILLRDEVPAKSSFLAFRNQLRQAVQRRDTAALKARSSPDIKLTFGRPLKLNALNLQNPNAPTWAQLDRILQTCAPYPSGGAGMMACPSTFAASHQSANANPVPGSGSTPVNPEQDIYIMGTQPVRSEPFATAPVVGTVSNEILQALPLPVLRPLQNLSVQDLRQMNQWFSQSETAAGWKYVSLPNGQKGFVSSRGAYAAIGYRALFAQDAKTKAWKMTVFLAGD